MKQKVWKSDNYTIEKLKCENLSSKFEALKIIKKILKEYKRMHVSEL